MFNEGFYCNWAIIEKAHTKEELIILSHNNTARGFMVWKIREFML